MSAIFTLILIQVLKAFVICQEECGLDVSSEPGRSLLCCPVGLTPCIDTYCELKVKCVEQNDMECNTQKYVLISV